MSLLTELNTILPAIVPVETGVFSDAPPDRYAVITPLSDEFDLHADNEPGVDIQAALISLFHKGNYTKMKNQIICAVLSAEMTITDRRYVGHEDDTGFHHYAIDVAKHYEMEE